MARQANETVMLFAKMPIMVQFPASMKKKAKKRGLFFVLEGPDKSGKSTQALLLTQALTHHGKKVVHTREPGGTKFAEAIRSLVLDPNHRVFPLAELLLYEAARAQHTEELIVPALNCGAVVVSERYTLATLAYQGYGRGLDIKLVTLFNKIATGGLNPELTLVLDIPESEFKTRDPNRRHDRLELESAKFRTRVRQAYRTQAKKIKKIKLLNARRPRLDLHVEILSLINPFFPSPISPIL